MVYNAINKELGRKYPYLRLALKEPGMVGGYGEGYSGSFNRRDMPSQTIDMSDSVRIVDLEYALQQLTGLPVQTFRRNGTIWLKISHTNHWTLREQNDRGRELDSV